MWAFCGGIQIVFYAKPREGRFGAFVAQFCGKARRPDFPAGEGRKGLPLGQAERVAVRPAR